MKVTFEGNPLTLVGERLKVGDKFPEFGVSKQDLNPLWFKDTAGIRIFLSVPSIDTPVCDLEVMTFNQRIKEIPDVTVYTVSMDLPFAQSRWCGAKGVENVLVVSDYHERQFAKATGTLIKELSLLTRAAFVVDEGGIIRYVDYLDEITQQPDFDAILNAAKALT